ncbi:hypothetical protein N7510_001303 [Penicillium lagena]|uniref:uncharacterized protein n=1 Tax=Penicillium lagena TaxID=94218 RepID=UPI0025413E9F|nr:uncharacterized protein N7510_001303 [Penicillium lagena]KAJ5624994.1 hypothetical protein N7510_001303 [Penicillium lagena]
MTPLTSFVLHNGGSGHRDLHNGNGRIYPLVDGADTGTHSSATSASFKHERLDTSGGSRRISVRISIKLW